jgi:hypothetical protein
MTTQAQIDALKAAYEKVAEGLNSVTEELDIAYTAAMEFEALLNTLKPDPIVVPPPPPPPPPATGEVVLLGNAIYNQQRAYGPADRAKWSDLQALIDKVPAWDIFADAEQRLAPSWDGAEPTRSWVRCHQYGNFNRLYAGSPQPDGAYVRNLGSKANGDDLMLNIVPYVKSLPMRPGPRGKHMSTPFGAVRAHSRRLPDGTLSMHPDIPNWVKVDVLGNIWYYMRDGSLRLPFTLKDVGGILDWCPVPSSRKEMLVADNGKGCVWHLLRDGANFTQTKYCDLPNVTSVISLPNGRQFATDKQGVYEITGGTPQLFVNLANAFYLDHFSNGDLCVGTLTPGLYRVTTGMGIITPLYGAARLNSWVQVSVDRNGTCGAKDTVYFAGSHFGTNDNIIIVKPNQLAQTGTQVFGSVQGQMSVGPLLYTMDPFGHYPWSFVVHEDEASIFVEGESDGQPSIWARNAGQFPDFGVYDHATFGTGIYIIRTGVDFSQPIGNVPSFTCQMSDSGWSGIGVCADVIAAMPYEEQVAFVQQGMAGSFPRPFLKGRSLYALLYHLNASSLRYLHEGGALLDNLKTYLAPTFGQELPALSPLPYAGVPGSDTFVEVRGGKVAFMNNVENPKVVPSSLLVDVFVDEGLPGQQIIRGLSSPWDVIIPSLAPGQHSIRPVVTNGDRTYWGRATVVSAP